MFIVNEIYFKNNTYKPMFKNEVCSYEVYF